MPCGRIGKLQRPTRARELALSVREALHAPAVTLAGEREVQTVAVLGGEGGDFVQAALAAGADAFLSGRIGYHAMQDAAEEGLCLIEAGHYATEFPVCEELARLVREADASIEIEIMNAPTIQTLAQ